MPPKCSKVRGAWCPTKGRPLLYASEQKIYINCAYISFSSILEMGRQIAKRKSLKNHPLISISCQQSGKLNHELEHARRSEDCSDLCNAHSHSIDLQGNYVDFETCASSYAQKAHQCGLFEFWAEELSSISL